MSENGKRRKYGAKEKVKILEEARQSGASVSEVCRRHGVSAGQFYQWEKQAREAAVERFREPKGKGKRRSGELDRLQTENQRLKGVIAEITAENLELKKNFGP